MDDFARLNAVGTLQRIVAALASRSNSPRPLVREPRAPESGRLSLCAGQTVPVGPGGWLGAAGRGCKSTFHQLVAEQARDVRGPVSIIVGIELTRSLGWRSASALRLASTI